MKKRNLFITCLCAVVLTAGAAATSFAGPLYGSGIVDSKHDMRSYTQINGGGVDADDQYGRVCAYCHTPHHAVEDSDADYMPLWSRTITDAKDFFIGYDNPTTLDAVIVDPLLGPSRLCMGCHDGLVAIDAYYGAQGNAALVEGDAFEEIGVGLDGLLDNDHPIGFDFEAVAALDNEINASTTAFTGGATIAEVLYDDGISAGGIMTCATCHDVHNGPTVDDNWFLYGKQEASAFCTTCHAK